MPELGAVLGTMTFGDTVDIDTATTMVDVALAEGVTRIDTANGYAGGAAESMLATILRGRRHRIELASKVGIPHPDAQGLAPLSADAIRRCVAGSLARLEVDSIDLLYLHQPDRLTPVEETLAALGELIGGGAIASWGVSNYSAWQVAELSHAARRLGLPGPRVGQQVYSIVARRLDEEYLEYARTAGIETMVYNPLAGGLLSGRHDLAKRPEHGRFGDSRLADMYTQRYWNAAMLSAVTELSKIADEAGVPLADLAIRWLVGRDGIDTVLLGGSRVDHLETNLASIRRGPLPDDVVAACDAVGAELRGPMPAYNR
ncbi:aldo/keto reductase [Microbacterium sp. RG1]|uniref:aldo/keto reductase n=1 Tax=Microbacterium sp. RG1 TaxID=2489212 RepID=UPI0010CA22F1|nr:aldo/keto reductase [Microbacterium sp. RG1]QCQ17596.1 aldo/keto reductase [Microbacterium sp. RG1]